MKVAVPKESRPGERRVAATPETVRPAQEARLRCLRRKPGRRRRVVLRRRLRQRGGDDRRRPAASCGQQADIVLKVQPPEQHPALGVHEVDLLRPGATLISFLWPGKNQALVERLAAAQGHRHRDRPGAAHHARAEDGRAVVDGQHRRLPRGHRGGELLRPLLHRPDDRGRPRAARQGAGHRRRRRRAGGDRRGARPRRDRARLRHARRRRASRSRAWAPSSSKLDGRAKKARAAAATPRR